MAKNPALELLSTLKSYFNQLSEGERTPTEVAAALNDWARESAESVKAKISEEVEASVSKMGFVKREEYDALVARIEEIEKAGKAKRKSAAPKAKSTSKSTSKSASSATKKSAKKASK
jgi:BMFP domain-containing protein YqiC